MTSFGADDGCELSAPQDCELGCSYICEPQHETFDDADAGCNDNELPVVHIDVPMGKLGLLFEQVEGGDFGHVVAAVRKDSVLRDVVSIGDVICSVSGTATVSMDHNAIQAYLVDRANERRTLSIKKGALRRNGPGRDWSLVHAILF